MCALLPCRAARTGASGAAAAAGVLDRGGPSHPGPATRLGCATARSATVTRCLFKGKRQVKGKKEKLFTELGNNNWVHS